MGKDKSTKVAFISSFLPRKCGIATFTSDLITNTSKACEGMLEPLVVAMRSDKNLVYNDPVKFEIRQNVKNDYICAADYINFSHVDLVCVQHEFGLFGGNAGSYLKLLLKKLNAPIVTTLHTILDEPDEHYYQSMVDVCDCSEKVIIMNERGIEMLRDIYGVSGSKVELVPHGIPDLPFVDNNYYKHKLGMEGRRTILTFGLLSKNKGIETMLKAMPAIIEAQPDVLYAVLGMTHPSVLKNDGESYRFSLQRMVNDLGIGDNVIFYNRFVTDEELHNFLCASDLYVTPYLNREQLTSGTLSFAVGTGKAVVSTPYWAACELLAQGRGIITDFGDSKAMAAAIIEILKDDTLFYTLRRKAYDYSRKQTWPRIGERYFELFKEIIGPEKVKPQIKVAYTVDAPDLNVPEISLNHLKRLTDDTGIYQHALFTIPRREHGYCTDDNSRAAIVMTKYFAQYRDNEAIDLLDKYLSFVLHSQNSDGTVNNMMNFDRSWHRKETLHDALGRVLWALGGIMAQPPNPSYLPTVKDFFDLSAKHVLKQYPRGMAYSIIGMYNYLRQFPGASDIKRYMSACAQKLVQLYHKHTHPDWLWFENSLTYDNAILPYAMFMAGTIFGEEYLEIANKTCEFLIEQTFDEDHFSFVGCKGWYNRGQAKAKFDQQPIEAASTILMLGAAYEVTSNKDYLWLQRRAFDWFLGKNDLQVPIYNFRTKGCYDGLTPSGVNENQGAESTLCFLLGLLSITENITDKEELAGEVKLSFNKLLRQIPVSGSVNSNKTAITELDQKKTNKKTD